MSYRNCDSFPQEFFFHDKCDDPGCGFCCSSPCCCCAGGGHDDHHDDPCCCRQQVAVSSATGSAGPITVTSVFPINVVSTNINTCRLGTTDNLISFSGIINNQVAVATTLVFQVLRSSCVGNAVAVGSAYTYSVAIIASQSFSFSFTDSNVAPGTYTYSVQLANGSNTAATGIATIMNATLNVTATKI